MGVGYVNGIIVGDRFSVNGVEASTINGEGIIVDGIQINIFYEYSIINIGRPPSTFNVTYTNCSGFGDSVNVSAGGPPQIICARNGTVSKPDPSIVTTRGPQC